MNIKLTIAYDGTAYQGWQRTGNGNSIEEIFEKILAKILQNPVALQAASRTDAGVHALGQVLNFITDKPFKLNQLQMSLIRLLPKDITVLTVEKAHDDFHPTLDCTSKEYHYTICYDTMQLPQNRLYSWHCPCALDITSMRQAAQLLEGKHDFKAFCNYHRSSSYSHYIRNIHLIEIQEIKEKRLLIRVKGDNFLYRMVRNIVGTLVDVGKHKISVNEIEKILAEKKRPKAGVTAPAHGLCLYEVSYISSKKRARYHATKSTSTDATIHIALGTHFTPAPGLPRTSNVPIP